MRPRGDNNGWQLPLSGEPGGVGSRERGGDVEENMPRIYKVLLGGMRGVLHEQEIIGNAATGKPARHHNRFRLEFVLTLTATAQNIRSDSGVTRFFELDQRGF